MKSKFSLFILFIGLISMLQVWGQPLEVTHETLSIHEIQDSPRYHPLNNFDPGHHKTLIRIDNLPQTETIRVKWKRPVFENEEQEYEFLRDYLIDNGHSIGEETPIVFMSSRGYLPGERIVMTISTPDGKFESKSIEFIPQPVVIESHQSNLRVSAELISMMHYLLTLEGFEAGEKLQFHSISSGEEMNLDIVYSKEMQLIVSPVVVGQKGGVAEARVIRSGGETIKLSLPWGERVVSHLMGESPPLVSFFTALTTKDLTKKDNKILFPVKMGIPENIDLGETLPEVRTYSKRLFDPFPLMSLDQEVIERFIVLKKGASPDQSTLSLKKKFLFVDGNNPRHFEWAKTHNFKEYSIVVVRGDDMPNIRDDMKGKQGLLSICPMEIGDVYFDIYGLLFQKVGVEKLPSRVSQQGNQILIEEVPITQKFPYKPE